jgi:hypothetical protein
MEMIPEFQAIRERAISHRTSVIAYSSSRRILESEEFGLYLSSKQYYNLIRKMKLSEDNLKIIAGLVAALEDEGFIYRTRCEDTIDS